MLVQKHEPKFLTHNCNVFEKINHELYSKSELTENYLPIPKSQERMLVVPYKSKKCEKNIYRNKV